MSPIIRETIVDRRQPQLRWSAVFAGTALSVGLWIMLQALGMGLGLSAVDTDDAGSLRGVGIGTGIWSLIAPLIAVFVGAFLTGRLAGTRERRVGVMHGSVTWALTTAIGLWAVVTLVSTMVNGVARAGVAAAQASSSVISGAARAGAGIDTGALAESLGIDSNDLVAPINQRLAAEGKPAVTAAQIESTLRAVTQRGVREGKLDRAMLVQELAKNTALSSADAEQIATDIERRYSEVSQRVKARAQEIGEQAKHAGLEAMDKAGKTLLFGGLMLLVSLGAALGGSALGARDRNDHRLPDERRDYRDPKVTA
jgi:hypothetical protein